MTDDVTLLRESIATLESQLREAEGRAQILAAQLGGWEAACAKAQNDAAAFLGTIYAAATLLRNRPLKTPYDDDIVRLLQHTIDERKGVGALLAAELTAARAVIAAARCVITHTNRNECAKIDNALLDYDEAMKARPA